MNTSDVITAYLAARRAQGVQFRSGARTLRRFARETGDLPLHEVTQQTVISFLRGHGALSATWTTKFRLLAGLYRFALTRGYVTETPLPEIKPKLPPQQTPYVYSLDELQRLLDSTAVVRSPLSPLQAMTYRTLLLILYGAGLRISEAIGLTVADVNISESSLVVVLTLQKYHRGKSSGRAGDTSGFTHRSLVVAIDERGQIWSPRGLSRQAKEALATLDPDRRRDFYPRFRAIAGLPDEWHRRCDNLPDLDDIDLACIKSPNGG